MYKLKVLLFLKFHPVTELTNYLAVSGKCYLMAMDRYVCTCTTGPVYLSGAAGQRVPAPSNRCLSSPLIYAQKGSTIVAP